MNKRQTRQQIVAIFSAERLMRMIAFDGDCWVVRRADGKTVENMSIARKTWSTPRIFWTLANGAVPPGKRVRRNCGNWKCCNPEHLYLDKVKL